MKWFGSRSAGRCGPRAIPLVAVQHGLVHLFKSVVADVQFTEVVELEEFFTETILGEVVLAQIQSVHLEQRRRMSVRDGEVGWRSRSIDGKKPAEMQQACPPL